MFILGFCVRVAVFNALIGLAGGGERVAVGFARAFEELGYGVTLFTFGDRFRGGVAGFLIHSIQREALSAPEEKQLGGMNMSRRSRLFFILLALLSLLFIHLTIFLSIADVVMLPTWFPLLTLVFLAVFVFSSMYVILGWGLE